MWVLFIGAYRIESLRTEYSYHSTEEIWLFEIQIDELCCLTFNKRNSLSNMGKIKILGKWQFPYLSLYPL